MTSRVLAAVAALWGAGFLVVYLAVVRGQGGTPARGYVVLVLLAVAAWAVGAVRSTQRLALLVGLVLAAVGVLAGLLSVGLLLVPALVAAAAALALRTGRLTEPGTRRHAAPAGRR